MSELISGKEAKLAWANGQDVELSQKETVMDWCSDFENYSCGVFNNNRYIFRLKPRTITINGVEYIDKQGAYEAFMEVYNEMDIHPDI